MLEKREKRFRMVCVDYMRRLNVEEGNSEFRRHVYQTEVSSTKVISKVVVVCIRGRKVEGNSPRNGG